MAVLPQVPVSVAQALGLLSEEGGGSPRIWDGASGRGLWSVRLKPLNWQT